MVRTKKQAGSSSRIPRREVEENEDLDVPSLETTPSKPKKVVTTYTPSQYLKALGKCIKKNTKWADKELLERLGILNDVRGILENIGIVSLLDMNYKAYYIPTLQLLSTISVNPKAKEVRFKVGSKSFNLSFDKVNEIYGFKSGGYPRVGTDAELHRAIWKRIGDGKYDGGSTKSASIANPAVRYVHKLLSNTICERKESDHIKKEEMHLLAVGMEPFLHTNLNRIYKVDVGVLLMRRLEKVKDWAMTVKKDPIISIGGLVTPLLMSIGIDLRNPLDGEERIDIPYLVKTHFLYGKSGGYLKYRFSRAGVEDCGVYLPNESITSILNPNNVRFLVDERYLVRENTGVQEPVVEQSEQHTQVSEQQPSFPRQLPQEQPQQQPQPQTQAQERYGIYDDEYWTHGIARYTQAPFEGQIPHPAIAHAIEGNAKNQEWLRWTTENQRKIAKDQSNVLEKIRYMTAAIKKYILVPIRKVEQKRKEAKEKAEREKDKAKGKRPQDGPSEETQDPDDVEDYLAQYQEQLAGITEDEALNIAVRNSISDFRGSSETPYDPPRRSGIVIGEKRRRSPTPPPPGPFGTQPTFSLSGTQDTGTSNQFPSSHQDN